MIELKYALFNNGVIQTMSKKIIISDGRKKEKKNIDKIDSKLSVIHSVQNTATEVHQDYAEKAEPIPLDENVWGNDNIVLQHLNAKQLADRRLFVRIRYLQQAQCLAISDNAEIEPEPLSQPFTFMVSDLSMGGIGIISNNEVGINKILLVRLTLDGIVYDVKFKVIYCFWNDNKFRAGLKVLRSEKQFIHHLKVFIARKTLNAAYGDQLENNATSN